MAGAIKYTTDHGVIRSWVEERAGRPAKYLRINFRGYVTRGAPRRVDWEKFFQALERRRLAFLYQDQTAAGKRSYYYQLVNRRAEQAAGHLPGARTPEPAGTGNLGVRVADRAPRRLINLERP